MQDTISTLFRQIELDKGTTELDTIVLSALVDAIKQYPITDIKKFQEIFKEIIALICQTEPKIAILMDHMFDVYEELLKVFQYDSKENQEKIKSKLLKKIDEVIKDQKNKKQQLLKNAKKYVNIEGKSILIFDHSHTVQDVLTYLHNSGEKFKVIVAEQDIYKTEDIIASLHKSNIPFEVIPSYMLSHYEQNVDMLFFGAVTLKNTYDFVLDPGSLAIISEFHLTKKKTVMFITTSKFSLWKSKRGTEVYHHPQNRLHSRQKIEYKRLKFSHDRVPSKLFDIIITEEGNFTASELKKNYDEKFKERQKQ